MSNWNLHITALVKELFRKDLDRLQVTLEELIEANFAKGGPQHGFLFHGKFCTTLPATQQRVAEKKILHPDLQDAGRAYFQDCAITEKEMLKITQGLHVILRPCNTAQDVRDILPDTAVNLLPPLFAKLDRTREPGWAFTDKPLQKHQFDEINDLIDFYVANRILL